MKKLTALVGLLVAVGVYFVAYAQGSVRFAVIGDYGLEGQTELDVANLVKGWNPDFIITTGDNNYMGGAASTIDENVGQYYHDFIYPYTGGYGAGASVNRFFPSLGNHDWETPNAQPYLDYFTLPGNERYYAFVQGPVRFFVLDSDYREPDGYDYWEAQGDWLQSALAASTSKWNIVYFHHPPYSSGKHGSNTFMQWPFKQWGADVIISGHDHSYERLEMDGLTYFVNGLGGSSKYAFETPLAGSQVRYNDDYGAMLVDANSYSITFEFYRRTGSLIDTHTLNKPIFQLWSETIADCPGFEAGDAEYRISEDSTECYVTSTSTPITGITWDDASTISRQADGSDGWPITWADDGDLYTVFADGNGFNGPDRLSMGFAKVAGSPHTHVGTVIASLPKERGNGAGGKKASGALMVDDRLWLWVRNVLDAGTQCELRYSDNHATDWTTLAWKFEEFGFCVFLNYGQNYAGARDNFVYMATHNNDSAYIAADTMVLTRVPKDQIATEASYEFFKELDVNDDPVWTTDITQRGAVITWTGKLARSGISYNAGLGRYIWWTQDAENSTDTRFGGGFRLWEAPEPWGPWTVFYDTQGNWDVGPGERAEFPPKWMSADGLDVFLVFSGDDFFSVRGATLTTD